MFYAGDFSGKSLLWWPDGDETPEGRELEDMFTSLGLSQVISEPANFHPGKDPSCIDPIVTDQPNIILDSGTRVSLDPFCHHQIIYCKEYLHRHLLKEKFCALLEQIQSLSRGA